ncbi:MAG: choice-of-anchor L domain-containing protein [Flavobacterium sp.]
MKKTLLLLLFIFLTFNSFSQADLKVINTDYKDYYTPGGTNTYTLTIVNLGPLAASNVSVYNAIPSGAIDFSWTGPKGGGGLNSAVSDLIPLLGVGEIAVYTISFAIPSSFASNLTSTAEVKSETIDPTPDCDQCVDIDKVGTSADIAVTNTDNDLYYRQGETSFYTVKVTNNGPLDAVNVKVSNLIPTGITQFSWTGSNASAGTNMPLLNTIALLKSGETVTYTISLKVPAEYEGDLISQAVVSSSLNDPDPKNNISADINKPLTGADIEVINTDNKLSYSPGTTNTYVIKVLNHGPEDAVDVHVVNAIPAGISEFSWIGSNGSNGTNVNLDNIISKLAKGEEVTYTISALVASSFTSDIISEVVVSSATPDPYPTCTKCVDIDKKEVKADIVVVNTNNQSAYISGGTSVYTITVTNNGPDEATDVKVVNNKPPGITEFSWVGSNGSGGANMALNNTIPTLAVGKSVIYTVTVKIPSEYTGNLISKTVVTSATIDPNPECLQCIDTDSKAVVGADLVVVNTDNKTHYTLGSTNVYTVTVQNNGPQDATNVHIKNAIPAGITQFSWVGSNGTSGTNALDEIIPMLANGSKITYTITIQIPANYTGDLVSQAEATSSVPDPNLLCVACIDTDTLLTGISVSNSDGSNSYIAGTTITYKVKVKNNGPDDAVNIVVTDLVSEGISQSDVTWVGNNGSSGTGDLTDIIQSLLAGNEVIYTIKVKVPADFDQKTNLVNEVVFSVNGLTNTAACPECKDVDTPNPSADLEVLITNNQEQFYLDSTVNYTIVVVNKGPSEAKNVAVKNKIPPGIESMIWSGSNGSSGTGDLSDTIASLPVGQMVTYVVVVKVPSVYSPPSPVNQTTILTDLINSVIVTSDTPDLNPSCPRCEDVDKPRADFVTVTTNGASNPNYMEDLVKNILIKSPCIEISNISSTATCGFGYFNRNNSDFPFVEGLVISNGQAKNAEGKYRHNKGEYYCSGLGDADLQEINTKNGNPKDILDASSVKFDFVAIGEKFSFKYLFASDEYGSFQCSYSDAFAFILKDITPGFEATPARNLAVIPGTATDTFDGVPVSVTNIRKAENKPGVQCGDSYPEFFGQFNETNIEDSDINFKGQTVPLIAYADVIPTHKYTVKMVIGDYSDASLDSAVFIEAGSFDLGQPAIVSEEGIRENLPLCQGTPQIIRSGKSKIPGVTYTWKRNGVLIPGADSNSITIDKEGVYSVTYSYEIGCEQTDDITVVYASPVPLQEPNDLFACKGANTTFDLTENVPVVLGGLNKNDFKIDYYHSQSDADNMMNPIANFDKYLGTEGETIFMAVEYYGAESSCIPVKTFKLLFGPGPSGTIKYSPETDVAEFCMESSSSINVLKSTVFTEGGVYSVEPTVGLTVDSITGDLNLANSIPGDYVISYKIAAKNGCDEHIAIAKVRVNACNTVVMNPISPICQGDSVVLTCTDMGLGITYVWSDEKGVLGKTTVPEFALPLTPKKAGNFVYSVMTSVESVNSIASSRILVVNPLPEPALKEKAYICADAGVTILDTELDSNQYGFVWYKENEEIANEVLNFYEATEEAMYKVEVVDLVTGCKSSSTTEVLKSVAPNTVKAQVATGYFVENAKIVVTASPVGDYQYQLDGGEFQESNIFEKVDYGNHDIIVRDKGGCAELATTVMVVDYPRFFTPNGDGFNDAWNISVLSDQSDAEIFIFDRYGKLLKQIIPAGTGWDGTLNGEPLPADDYWFVVNFTENGIKKTFKSNFSLLR